MTSVAMHMTGKLFEDLVILGMLGLVLTFGSLAFFRILEMIRQSRQSKNEDK